MPPETLNAGNEKKDDDKSCLTNIIPENTSVTLQVKF
jgi:hypothetical protein